MKILIVAGFLGSGKTTLILSTIERLNEISGQEAAIIVNNFGTVGIDGKMMEKYGLEVKEVMGGCICCSLGPYLLDTVQKLAITMEPELMVIEPSGIADPQQILDTLEDYQGPELDFIRTISVMDVERFDQISRYMGRPFEHQVRSSEVIVLNKIDEVDENSINQVEERLREIGFEGSIVRASATERMNMDDVVKAMVNR
jgi:G3E family GTPase